MRARTVRSDRRRGHGAYIPSLQRAGRYAARMDSSSKGSQVRLAELVAAIWLGIDLGFGQPMEHVLRQCLIALRLTNSARRHRRSRA